MRDEPIKRRNCLNWSCDHCARHGGICCPEKCDEYRPYCNCGDFAKLVKTVDTRFDICQDVALVLKIGRDYQNKDGYRGAHYDTVKLLCDTIEYQQEQLKNKTEVGNAAKLREATEAVLLAFNYGESTIVNQLPFSKLLPMLRKCVEALAAPPRNCDVPYNGRLEMYYAFKGWCNARGHTMEPRLASYAFDWLLAIATDEKGGAECT